MLKQYQQIIGVESIKSVVQKNERYNGYETKVIVKIEGQDEELQFVFVSSDPIYVESIRHDYVDHKKSTWDILGKGEK
tara:strand:- start:1266 stop:1499 length:234 start_codon:yes stop_codon:yes gene_type:complete